MRLCLRHGMGSFDGCQLFLRGEFPSRKGMGTNVPVKELATASDGAQRFVRLRRAPFRT